MLGGAMMIPRAEGSFSSEFTFVGLTAGTARPGLVGVDMAFVVAPRALGYGFLVIGTRANIAVPVPLASNVLLIPSAGATLLGGIGAGGGDVMHGLNGSVAVAVFDKPLAAQSSSIGLRVALAVHRFGSEGNARIQVLEFGIVRRRR